jgi:pyruvate dehydrogenase (quinone)
MDWPGATFPRAGIDHRPVIRPSDADLTRLAEMLNSAKKVALFCGVGCAGAHDEVITLAETVKAPMGHAYRGKSYLEYDNPFDVGMNGLLGFGAAYQSMHECDLLLLLGTDFPYDKFLPTKPKIVQVDIRVEHLGRRSKLDLGLWGDVGETIRALLPLVQVKQDRTFLDAMLGKYKDAVRKLNVYVDHVGKRRPMHPEPVAATLNELAAPDAIFTADTGMCNVWSSRYIRAMKDRRLIGSFSHGSMANALPQAIGAQMCFPGRQVISMSGDGGLAMLMGDLLTLVQHNLPVKIVLFNNGVLGMVKLEMEVAGLPDWQTDLINPNFANVAQAIGLKGIRIEDPADLRAGLMQALQYAGPALIDVVTDPNALSMPSHITADQVEGFALTMGKLVLSGHVDEVVDTIKANFGQI